jgi:2-methylcitrate dehydratase PrpD
MNRMSGRYASVSHGSVPTPVTINFSVPWNVAVVLLAGELTPRQIAGDWLSAHASELRDIAERVQLRHDWSLTRAATEAFAGLVPFGRVAREAGLGGLRTRAKHLRSKEEGASRRGGELRGLHHMIWPPPDLKALRSARPYWDPSAVDTFKMTFPAHVQVVLKDGTTREATCSTPRGGAGNTVEGPEAISSTKLSTYGPWLWDDEGTEALSKAIDSDEDDIWERL